MKRFVSILIILLFSGCIFTPPQEEINVGMYNKYHNKIINVALKQMGVPYRYGGMTPNGFDCSGFVCYVYKKARDKKLPRTAEKQANYVRALDRDELREGDLLFFDTYNRGKISHCGIYMGSGKFIHATSGKAYRVTISSLNSPHYKRAFRWGGRVD